MWKNKDSVFIMGRDTNCKQDVVNQNGDVCKRERDFSFSFVASVVNDQFLTFWYALNLNTS